ncbi:MAG: hypothetical protein J6L70_01870 [Alphaproteobacteria bacterium]|nr:hypothetical protein [Alphaproteobacteria bacterium]
MKTYFSVGFTAVMMLNCPRALAFETTTITITCVPTELNGIQNPVHKDCISVNKTEEFQMGPTGHITCICPTDSEKLITYSCHNKLMVDSLDPDDPYDTLAPNYYQAYFTDDGCFSCESGYFNSGTGCVKCFYDKAYNDNGESDSGAVGVNECYLPQDTSMSDDTGEFVFVNNCYYSGDYTAFDTSDAGSLEEESTTTTAT